MSKIAVLAFDLEGKYITRYESYTQAEYSGFTIGGVSAVVNNRGFSHRGHIFIKEEDYTDELLEEKVAKVKSKYSCNWRAIVQLEMDGVTVIRQWNSIKEAETKGGFNQNLIWNVLQGKNSHHGGYLWRYVEDTKVSS